MRDNRFFTTAFAAAIASLLGLGAGAAADLNRAPQSYETSRESDEVLPAWLVRYKLRRLGYQDILHVSANGDGLVIRAVDRWGREVKLCVDPHDGRVLPRAGYGLAHLRAGEVERRLAALGYECLRAPNYRDGHYRALVRDETGRQQRLGLDALSGAVWTETV